VFEEVKEGEQLVGSEEQIREAAVSGSGSISHASAATTYKAEVAVVALGSACGRALLAALPVCACVSCAMSVHSLL